MLETTIKAIDKIREEYNNLYDKSAEYIKQLKVLKKEEELSLKLQKENQILIKDEGELELIDSMIIYNEVKFEELGFLIDDISNFTNEALLGLLTDIEKYLKINY